MNAPNIVTAAAAAPFARLPPHNAEAEMCLLGSLMLVGDDRAAFDRIRAKVRPEDFYQVDHQVIFAAIVAMADADRPLDAVLLRDELARRGELEEVGGSGYLATVLGTVPSAVHGEHYATAVREKSVLRQCITISNDLLRSAYAPTTAADEATARARAAAERLWQLAATGTADKFVRLSEAVAESLDAKGDNVPRTATGLVGLDGLFGGIPKRKFTLVGGRPGMGKSLICKQVALNAARRGEPVGIVTIEEERGKIADNAVANLGNVENQRLSYGRLDEVDWRNIMGAVEKVSGLPFWINDEPSRLSEVEEAITTAAVKHGCKLVVVDYLQLIDPDSGPGDNENREITKVSKALKRLAKRLDIALVAACQLNRGNESGAGVRAPTLRDLRGSGSLEQDGDLIILLHRPDYYLADDEIHLANGQLKAIVAKNKDGPTGTVPLKFVSRHQRIEDWDAFDNGTPTGGVSPDHF